MNIVGPLANPALAGRQVVGVSERRRLPLMAGALASLGTVHALIVYGEPGMDEVSPIGMTEVIEIRDAEQRAWTIDPREYGYDGVSAADLAGAMPEDNARLIEAVLRGEGPRGARAAVVLNAGAALYVGGVAASYGDGVKLAETAIESGAGRAALERLRAATRR